MAATAAFCRVASVGKEFYVAFVLGASVATDAYALVMLIPALVMALLVQATRSAFLSLFPQQAADDVAAGERLANQFLGELVVVAAALAAFAGALLIPLWPHLLPWAESALVATSRPLIVPAAALVAVYAAISALSAILNARGRFTGPQATALLPTAGVVCLLALWGRDGGARALVFGLLAGAVLQCGILAAMLVRSGHPLRLRLGFGTPPSRLMWRMALPIIAVSVLSQVNVYVDRSMASSLDSGAVAVLAWSGMIRDVISGTLIGAFVSVLLPHFAAQAAAGRQQEMTASCQQILRGGAVVLFLVSALTAVCVPLALRHLQWGALQADATVAIGLCLAAYGLGFYADLASNTLYQALLSFRRVRLLLALSLLVSFLPNIAFNLLLIRPLGAIGLALSTSLVGYCTLAANYYFVRSELKFSAERSMWFSVGGALLAAGVAGGAGYWAGAEAAARVAETFAGNVIAAAVAAATILAVWLFLTLIFPGHADARRLLSQLRPKSGART